MVQEGKVSREGKVSSLDYCKLPSVSKKNGRIAEEEKIHISLASEGEKFEMKGGGQTPVWPSEGIMREPHICGTPSLRRLSSGGLRLPRSRDDDGVSSSARRATSQLHTVTVHTRCL
jgi:hypothetical protein